MADETTTPNEQAPTTPPPAEAGGTPQTDAAPQIEDAAKTVAADAETVAATTLTDVIAATRNALHTLNQLVTHGPNLLDFGGVQREFQAAVAKIDAFLGQQTS